MAPVPAACQELADQVAALEAAYGTLAEQAKAMVGEPAWTALGQLGALLMQLTSQRNELSRCVATHSAALTGTVVVIDASGGPAPGSQTVTLWDLAAGGATAREIAQVQAGAFGFQGHLPAQSAITVQTAGAADVTGLDFRSGSLPGPLAGQTPRIEIVLGPTLTVPAKSLNDWAASIRIPEQSIPPFIGVNTTTDVLKVAVVSLTATLATDVITITANGLVTGGIIGGEGPISVTASVALVAANSPNTNDVAVVTLVGANPIQASVAAGGLLGSIASVASTLWPVIGPLILGPLNEWANQTLGDAVATGFALASLPVGTRISLRKLKINESGVTFQPSVGLIGTGLSSFVPAPLPVPKDN
jgi:hypothetical protein